MEDVALADAERFILLRAYRAAQLQNWYPRAVTFVRKRTSPRVKPGRFAHSGERPLVNIGRATPRSRATRSKETSPPDCRPTGRERLSLDPRRSARRTRTAVCRPRRGAEAAARGLPSPIQDGRRWCASGDGGFKGSFACQPPPSSSASHGTIPARQGQPRRLRSRADRKVAYG